MRKLSIDQCTRCRIVACCLAAVGCIVATLAGTDAFAAETAPSSDAFENAAADWGLDLPLTQVQLADLDGDGWLDCLANHSTLLLNRPDGTSRRFEDAGDVGLPKKADLLVTGDVDGDGDLDLFAGVRNELEFWRKDAETGKPAVDENGAKIPNKTDEGHRNAIYLNDGTGRFSVVAGSGLAKPAETTSAATFVDYNLDGILDLFVGNWYRSYGWSYDGFPDRLYRGNGDGTFVDVTATVGLSVETAAGTRASCKPTFGVAGCDWNNDGFPDLFGCSYGRRWNQQWRNDGGAKFVEIAESTTFDGDAICSGHYPGGRRAAEKPFRANGNTFDVTFADYDNDGDFDAFLGEITHAWAGSSSDRSVILENLGASEGYRFQRRDDIGIVREHQVERWNQGDIYAGWIDANGDGLEDLFISSSDYPDDQRLRLFVQTKAHRFVDSTTEYGLDWPASNQPSVGDVDGDGDPDLIVARSLRRLDKETRAQLGKTGALWLNHGGNNGNWLKVRVRGRGAGGCNTRGIGCKIVVTVGERKLYRFVQSASGHQGHQNPDEVIVGLGDSPGVDSITIHWANAARTVSTGAKAVPAGHIVTFHEPIGDAAPRVAVAAQPGS